jgi:hypothetical protein
LTGKIFHVHSLNAISRAQDPKTADFVTVKLAAPTNPYQLRTTLAVAYRFPHEARGSEQLPHITWQY